MTRKTETTKTVQMKNSFVLMMKMIILAFSVIVVENITWI